MTLHLSQVRQSSLTGGSIELANQKSIKMNFNDQDKIAIAREYFIRADQGRANVLELFHEDAEFYFPKFGFGFGRESIFEMVKGFDDVLE